MMMVRIDIGQIHDLDVSIIPWHREPRLYAQLAICSPYMGVGYPKFATCSMFDEVYRRMIFFAIGLSILIFYTTDIVALTVVIPIWVVVLLLTTWPVLAANNFHVSVAAMQAYNSWKVIMRRMIITRRQ
jgi:hypothetical protein